MNHIAKKGLSALAFVVVLLQSGCGPKTGEVKGKVVFADGTPVPMAAITFINEKGRTKQGNVTDGEFTLTGVPTGDEVKVTVSTKLLVEQIAATEKMQAQFDQRQKGDPRTSPDRKLPEDRPMPRDGRMPGADRAEDLKHDRESMEGMAEQVKAAQLMKTKLVPVPGKYEKPDHTPLNFKITTGSQDIVIKLER